MVRKAGLKNTHLHNAEASLTVEAALVMPLFLYLLIAFLFFIQILTLQEQLQSAITKMGLNLAKAAYVYQDFIDTDEVQNFDQTIFNQEFDDSLQSLSGSVINANLLKLYAMDYLDINQLNHSCIKDGFSGIHFSGSEVMNEENDIDIMIQYQIRIPIRIFALKDMNMLQRIKLRSWTGYQLPPAYSLTEENTDAKDKLVYITESGSVYHLKKDCSHITLSIRSVFGIPDNLRNDSGGKYYPCEACIHGNINEYGTFYITSDGTRYHSRNDCSKIKRNIKAVRLSQVEGRRACKRCGGSG